MSISDIFHVNIWFHCYCNNYVASILGDNDETVYWKKGSSEAFFFQYSYIYATITMMETMAMKSKKHIIPMDRV